MCVGGERGGGWEGGEGVEGCVGVAQVEFVKTNKHVIFKHGPCDLYLLSLLVALVLGKIILLPADTWASQQAKIAGKISLARGCEQNYQKSNLLKLPSTPQWNSHRNSFEHEVFSTKSSNPLTVYSLFEEFFVHCSYHHPRKILFFPRS
jgi:hypothetical protein